MLRKKGRGGNPDAYALKGELVGAWEQWEDKIEELSKEEQEQIKTKYNSFIDGEDDLGDILFGDSIIFEVRLTQLLPADLNKYTNAVHKEIIDEVNEE